MGKVSGKKKNASRQRDKRKREKALKRKRARKPHSPQEKDLMARTDDITFIDQRLAAMQEEVNQIGEKFQAYYGEVQQEIVELIQEAGIFEDIQRLELERDEVRKKAEARVAEFQTEADELVKAKGFLMQREGVEAPQVEVEASEESEGEEKVTGAAVIDKLVAEGTASAPWQRKKVKAKEAGEPAEKAAIEENAPADETDGKKKRRVSAPDF